MRTPATIAIAEDMLSTGIIQPLPANGGTLVYSSVDDAAERDVEVPDRDPAAGEPQRAVAAHHQAARTSPWSFVRSLPSVISASSTSSRRSISASLLAAVIWIRKPTSLRGTSG